MLIIGISGFKRSGKNTAADVLVAQFGFKHYAFADALRTMAKAANPIIDLDGAPEEVTRALLPWRGRYYRYSDLIAHLGYDVAKTIPDFRLFLQRLGTEAVRDVLGTGVWVSALSHKLTLDKPERVVISDARFDNEVTWIHSRGGKVWRVVRRGVGGDDVHPSEVQIPYLLADREVMNDSSQSDFEWRVADAMRRELSLRNLPVTYSLPNVPPTERSGQRDHTPDTDQRPASGQTAGPQGSTPA